MNTIEDLVVEAMNHKAVNHPYLKALKEGEFNDPLAVIKDFSIQYAGYTSWFPKFLTASISKMNNPYHREYLINNLREENGSIDTEDMIVLKQMGIEEDWVQGIPHPELFRRFQKSMHISPDTKIDETVEIWREMFLNILYNGSDTEVIGAIGIGTESIVKHVYKFITTGIQNHTGLKKYDYVFFELHSEIDDEHGKIMIRIAKEMAKENPDNYTSIRKGMLKALNLRVMFWDRMYERAKNL